MIFFYDQTIIPFNLFSSKSKNLDVSAHTDFKNALAIIGRIAVTTLEFAQKTKTQEN